MKKEGGNEERGRERKGGGELTYSMFESLSFSFGDLCITSPSPSHGFFFGFF